MGHKYSIQNIELLKDRKIFFDANILIYLFWPSGSFNWEKSYASILKKLLTQKNELCIDFLVISEIINRIHRIEFSKCSKINKSLNYKSYRNSVDGQTTMLDIYTIISTNILNHFTVLEKSFSKIEIQSFLTIDSLDFSDKAILLTCSENNCVLITNDADYKASSIDILSSNPSILNK